MLYLEWGAIMARKKKPAADPAIVSDYYDYTAIMAIPAIYRVIIGQRSNGKTYGWAKMAMDHYLDDGLPSAYVRRMDEMIKPKNIGNLFDPQIDYIREKTNGDYNSIEYRANGWYLTRVEQNSAGAWVRVAKDVRPFCRSYAISTMETTKGADNGEVWSVCFDEFMTRAFYLSNEFVLFTQLLSSIIRDRDGVQIFMIANTVTKSCPYFKEMGLYRVLKQDQGTIDVYQLGKDGDKIAVEYCAAVDTIRKKVSKYYAFDNPQLEMITSGGWEMALYRHAPQNLSQYRIILTFFVIHDGITLQGDIHIYQRYPIIFWHYKTGEIKNPERTIIYSMDVVDGNPLHQRDLKNAFCRAQTMIFDLIRTQKTFYADNETGEAVAAYLRTQKLQAR